MNSFRRGAASLWNKSIMLRKQTTLPQFNYYSSSSSHPLVRNITVGLDINATRGVYSTILKENDKPKYGIIDHPFNNVEEWKYPRKFNKEQYSTICKQLIDKASNETNEKVDSVVLTVPVAFNELDRFIVLQAAKQLNVQVKKVITDSTSAALGFAYLANETKDGYLVVVYLDDSGFSFSLAEVAMGVVDVLASDGAIQKRSHNEENASSSYESNMAQAVLERIKHYLNAEGLKAEDVENLLLLGSLSAKENVKQVFTSYFGKSPVVGIDQPVASGAAVEGAILEGKVGDMILLNALSHAVSVGTEDGLFALAWKNSTFPLTHTKMFNLTDDSDHIHINFYQGTEQDHVLLGQITFNQGTKGGLYAVGLDVDANGFMTGTVEDKQTGEKHSIQLNGSSLDNAHTCGHGALLKPFTPSS